MAGVYFLYSATLALLLTLTLPWWLLQMLRRGKYRAGLGERLGMVPARIRLDEDDESAGRDAPQPGTRQVLRCGYGPTDGPPVADAGPLRPQALRPVAWIHAVSVGEVMAIAPLVAGMRGRGYRVLVSTTTHTGQRLARDKFGAANVFYFPLDFGLCIKPYLRALRPELVILAETEFWPNFLRLARASGARLAVVNARISDRSLPRYRRWGVLLRRVLEPVDLFLAQSEEDADRLRAVGAAAGRVEVCGNLKFDVAPPVETSAVTGLGEQLRSSGAPILVAGSTVEDEEDYVLQAFRMVLGEYPAASLVLAPRHRERFEEVARLLAERRFRFVRRSAGDAAQTDLRGAVLLLDTLGELAAIYRYANLAFVGGSLVARGGHNILEPAFFARAILTGPHTENFRDILACFERRRAVVRCTTKNLGITFLLLLRESSEREALGQRALQVLTEERGATARSLARIVELAQRGRG
jgi:3-deoxy-D-manno-octulosonic-acid transferase